MPNTLAIIPCIALLQPDTLTAALILAVWGSLGLARPYGFLWRAPLVWASGTAPHALRVLIACFAPSSWCATRRVAAGPQIRRGSFYVNVQPRPATRCGVHLTR